MRLFPLALAMLATGAAVAMSPDETGGADHSSPSGEVSPQATEGVTPAAEAAAAAAAAAKPAPKPARAKPKAEPDDGLVEAVVRRGTVVTGTFDKPVSVGPGGTVRLTPEEVAAMRADGVLVDPDGIELPAFDGPTVGRG